MTFDIASTILMAGLVMVAIGILWFMVICAYDACAQADEQRKRMREDERRGYSTEEELE